MGRSLRCCSSAFSLVNNQFSALLQIYSIFTINITSKVSTELKFNHRSWEQAVDYMEISNQIYFKTRFHTSRFHANHLLIWVEEGGQVNYRGGSAASHLTEGVHSNLGFSLMLVIFYLNLCHHWQSMPIVHQRLCHHSHHSYGMSIFHTLYILPCDTIYINMIYINQINQRCRNIPHPWSWDVWWRCRWSLWRQTQQRQGRPLGSRRGCTYNKVCWWQ